MASIFALLGRASRTIRRRFLARTDVPVPPPNPPADAPGTADARLRALTEADELIEALNLVRAELRTRSQDRAYLRLARSVAQRSGELSLQREIVELESRLSNATSLARRRRLLLGQWRDLSPDWSPAALPAPPALAGRRPGRVLHVLKLSLPHRQSGYSVRSMYVMHGQQQVGLDPVAVTAPGFPDASDPPVTEVVSGVRHHRLLDRQRAESPPLDIYLDDWASALTNVAVAERPELIHVHSGYRGYETARVALAVGSALDVPVVYEVRGFFESLWSADPRFNESAERYVLRREIETWCMQRAAAVVTLSETMRNEIMARGVDGERVFVVPNGVDTATFTPRPRSTSLASALGLTGLVFGYVSNLDHVREGQELLIEAAIELRAAGTPATALIVGDGERRVWLEQRAQALNAGDAVVFTGKVPHSQVLDYYALMDVFVVPRINERAARLVTPLKPYEAMAMGIPLLVSDLPALQEIAGDGRGSTFRTADAGDLARALADLADHPHERKARAERALDWVRRDRDWACNGARYRAVYDTVLGSSTVSAAGTRS